MIFAGAPAPIQPPSTDHTMTRDLAYYVCLDIDSGTFFSAQDACLIDTRSLSPEELDLLDNGTDTDRALLGDKYGLPWSFVD